MPVEISTGMYSISNNMLIENKGISIDDYPILPIKENCKTEINCKISISDIIKFYDTKIISKDMKFNLSGFFIDTIDKKIVATDGNRLMMFDIEIEIDPDSISQIEFFKKQSDLIIDLYPLINLLKLYKTESITKLYISENNIIFTIDDVEISTRIIGQKFPNYKNVIPEKYEFQIDFTSIMNTNFEDLKTGGRNNAIRFFCDEIRGNLLSITFTGANDQEFLIETEIKIDSGAIFPDDFLSFNKPFLIAGLKINPILGFNDIDSSLGNSNYIIMPLNA